MIRQNNGVKGDKMGPRYVVKVYNSKYDVWGYLVIDNTKLGPGKGGIRMTPTVTEEEVGRLARAMTEKNALAGIPFGGAKSGIAFDPKNHSPKAKKEIVEWFARELAPFLPKFYIAGPDVNMGEVDMATFVGAVKNKKAATGKPKKLGGLPHELGSTGYGVVEAVKIALAYHKIPLAKATIAIEGFGNVGTFAAQFLSDAGARVVAVSDSKGAVYLESGLDYQTLMKVKQKTGSVINYPGATVLPAGDIFTLAIDVLIPAALPDVINDENVDQVKALIIVEGANIPMRREHELALHARGLLIIPDIVANSGGVISSYAEHVGFKAPKMFALVKQKVRKSVQDTLKLSQAKNIPPREAAERLVLQKLRLTKN